MIDYSEARLKSFMVLSQLVKFTFVTFTESKPGRDGSKTRSMVCLLVMETPYSTFFEMLLNLLLPLTMTNP